MLKNYTKIAFRNLWRNKGYSFINIFGLAVGLASCIIILLYVTHELSYDKHYENSDRIYRVASKVDFSGNYMQFASAPAPMGPTLKQDYPEVEAMVRFRPYGSELIRRGEENFKEENIVFADATLFNVFSIPVIHGDPKTALSDPFTLAISESMARKYFDRSNAVGETLLFNDSNEYEVTAVYEDMPVASHFHFDFIRSMATIDEANNGVWVSHNFRTYILLKDGTDPEAFEENFESVIKTYVEPQIMQFMGVGLEGFREAGNSIEYDLQPLTEIHLYSNLTGEFEPNGSIMYVYLFSGLAVFVLILACINFMNLATARSVKRAKEVGVRKTLGSMRGQLTRQFFSESILFTIIAFLIAMVLVELSLPFFSELAGREIVSSYISSPQLIGIIALIVLSAGFLAGSYPALMLSSLKPVQVLKGRFHEKAGHGTLRKGLVVFQFTISIFIVVGLLVINKQLDYIQNRELGFKKDQVIIVNDAYALGDTHQAIQTFRDQILDYPVFESATISSFYPVEGYGKDDRSFWPKGESPSEENLVNMQHWSVDEDYIPTMEMEIVEGRNFAVDRDNPNESVILNEAAVDRFGFENPVGEIITIYEVGPDGSLNMENLSEYEIVGVVENFHYESLRENITPLGLFYGASYGSMAFKVASTDISKAVGLLEENWKVYAPSQPFSFSFLDNQFEQMYRAETNMQDLMTAFSVLTLIIACLGLLGLSAYSVERRTKEIGIRKVLGANVPNILGLISGEFLKLILLSFVLAIPLAYISMNLWLREFAYRTEIGFEVFVWAGLGMMIVALVTVSWQSIKAALMNPVNSLRSE